MSWNIIHQKEAALLGLRRLTLAAFATSLTANVFLAGALVFRGTTVQTVLVPMGINTATHTMSVQKHVVDHDYLSLVARDLLSLALNVTPTNVDFNRRALLAHAHPEGYGELEQSLLAHAERIKTLHASQSFAIASMRVDPEKLTIVFEGTRTTFIGERQTRRERMTLEMRLTHIAGRLRLLSLKPQP